MDPRKKTIDEILSLELYGTHERRAVAEFLKDALTADDDDVVAAALSILDEFRAAADDLREKIEKKFTAAPILYLIENTAVLSNQATVVRHLTDPPTPADIAVYHRLMTLDVFVEAGLRYVLVNKYALATAVKKIVDKAEHTGACLDQPGDTCTCVVGDLKMMLLDFETQNN